MNGDFYNSLPADLKKVVDDASALCTEAARQFQDTNLEKFSQEIRDYGSTFVELTSAELSQFETRAKQTWSIVQADCSPEVYNAFMGALERAK
jgi:TRAP-type C4-dicarboxylate transport system substrate-binding protein